MFIRAGKGAAPFCMTKPKLKEHGQTIICGGAWWSLTGAAFDF